MCCAAAVPKFPLASLCAALNLNCTRMLVDVMYTTHRWIKVKWTPPRHWNIISSICTLFMRLASAVVLLLMALATTAVQGLGKLAWSLMGII